MKKQDPFPNPKRRAFKLTLKKLNLDSKRQRLRITAEIRFEPETNLKELSLGSSFRQAKLALVFHNLAESQPTPKPKCKLTSQASNLASSGSA